MTAVVSCIDGSAISTAVCDAGAWASQRLNAPLKLLHVLDKSAFPVTGNFSGNIGPDARDHLLQELTALDEQRSRLALEHGKHVLDQAEQRASEDGAVSISKQQRHGSLMESLLELQPQIRILVMGRLGEDHDVSAHTLGSQVESVVRALHRPILVTVGAFTPPRSFMLAYDASATAQKALEMIATSPLLQGLSGHLVMVGEDSEERRRQLAQAAERLAGFELATALLDGEVQPALSAYQLEHDIELMVMGAYGHSRIRQFFVGGNTSRMIGMSDIPLLLLR